MKKILIACEFSQTICKAFRNKGLEAYSCDILPAEGGHPEWHIQDDVLSQLHRGWDMLIAHPPCTYISKVSVQHLHNDKERWVKLLASVIFFHQLLNAPIKRICVENSVPHRYARLPHYSQILQPHHFGHEVTKQTCLWLKRLPPLFHTKLVGKGERYIKSNGKSNGSFWYFTVPNKDRSKIRSITFSGVAEAMAEQWTPLL